LYDLKKSSFIETRTFDLVIDDLACAAASVFLWCDQIICDSWWFASFDFVKKTAPLVNWHEY